MTPGAGNPLIVQSTGQGFKLGPPPTHKGHHALKKAGVVPWWCGGVPSLSVVLPGSLWVPKCWQGWFVVVSKDLSPQDPLHLHAMDSSIPIHLSSQCFHLHGTFWNFVLLLVLDIESRECWAISLALLKFYSVNLFKLSMLTSNLPSVCLSLL